MLRRLSAADKTFPKASATINAQIYGAEAVGRKLPPLCLDILVGGKSPYPYFVCSRHPSKPLPSLAPHKANTLQAQSDVS